MISSPTTSHTRTGGLFHFAEASLGQPMFVGASVQHRLVGTRCTDYSSFDYCVTRFTTLEVCFRIPETFGGKPRLERGDVVDINIAVEGIPAGSIRGPLADVSWDDTTYSPLYRLSLANQSLPEERFNQVPLSGGTTLHKLDLSSFESLTSVKEEIKQLLQDSIIRKKGITVLLRHLQSYFSRLLARKEKDYKLLRYSLWAEIENSVSESLLYLERMLIDLDREGEAFLCRMAVSDLLPLREALLSEIPFILCKLAFEKARALTYIRSLKRLEQIFSRNYNSLVLLFSRAEEFVPVA